ncbi:unnamed protein product [Didymodactylos carnosus]|uniref:Uncharacterized protein n=1 Tax=Didymodactylos carnosus TaxID=1234261 RepID=A0A815GSJ3_9BILA|nr:unnamed protein product [Didymodactylos carnosus]CAF4208005.1 unnamed protein product [Didymodactylos carnosus]
MGTEERLVIMAPDQDSVLEPVLSPRPEVAEISSRTNVAKTSVTIDGIKHGIESGMVKEKMWHEKLVTYESMNECSHPEIICIQPTLAILKLKNFGIDSVELFEWLEPSPLGRIREAHQTLIWLKALNDNNSLTDLSRNMSHLGVDPK